MTKFFSSKMGGSFHTYHDYGSMADPYVPFRHTVIFNTQAWTRCAVRMEVSLLDKQGDVVRVVSESFSDFLADLASAPDGWLEVPGVHMDVGPYFTFELTLDDTEKAVTLDDRGGHFTLFATVEVLRLHESRSDRHLGGRFSAHSLGR